MNETEQDRLRCGMLVRDNEMPSSAPMVVDAIESGRVALRAVKGDRRTVVALRRIHMDGKPRKSGWSVVP